MKNLIFFNKNNEFSELFKFYMIAKKIIKLKFVIVIKAGQNLKKINQK